MLLYVVGFGIYVGNYVFFIEEFWYLLDLIEQLGFVLRGFVVLDYENCIGLQGSFNVIYL